MKDQLCKTCKHAIWMMTNENPPRIVESENGKCGAPISKEDILRLLPKCATTRYLDLMIVKNPIWYFSNAQCLRWEPKK